MKRTGKYNRKQPSAVYVEPVQPRPSCCIPLTVSLHGKGDLFMTLPSYLSGLPARVTSVQLSIASDTVGHARVGLYVADANSQIGSTLSMVSREFVTSQSVQSVSLRNGSRTEHGEFLDGSKLLSVEFSDAVVGTAVGVLYISILGSL